MRTRVHLRTLWKHRWILATAMCAGAAMAIALAVRQSPVYQAQAQVFIAPDTGEAAASGSGEEGAASGEELAPYVTHVESVAMAEIVIRRESLDFTAAELANKVEASVLPESRVVSIYVRDSDSIEAQNLADAFATSFVEEGVRQVGAGDARASVLEPAPLPEEPVSPKPLRDGLIGLGLGALAGIFLTFILKRPTPKTSKTKTHDVPSQAELGFPPVPQNPPSVDLKPALRSTEDLEIEDESLDEEIEASAMDEEEPASMDKSKDPLAIYPATRTFLDEPDRSPARATTPLGDDESISVRIREAVRRGMSAATSYEGELVGKRPESELPVRRLRPSIAAAEAKKGKRKTSTGSDATGADVEYEEFWQLGREHHDPAGKEKPRDAKSKKKGPKA